MIQIVVIKATFGADAINVFECDIVSAHEKESAGLALLAGVSIYKDVNEACEMKVKRD